MAWFAVVNADLICTLFVDLNGWMVLVRCESPDWRGCPVEEGDRIQWTLRNAKQVPEPEIK